MDHRSDFSNFWKVELIYMKVQVCSSAEPPLEYSQDQISSNKSSLVNIFSIDSGVTWRWCRLVVEGRTGKMTD